MVVRALIGLLTLIAATSVGAATLTITPDKSMYVVGETVTLSVFGDAQGGADGPVFGWILFDENLADYLSATQTPLTSLNGGLQWNLGTLEVGNGVAEAFDQFLSLGPEFVDGPLMAALMLEATSPGVLNYSWAIDVPLLDFSFFGVVDPPGGSITIVPETSTGLLFATGVVLLGFWRQRLKGRRRRGSTRLHLLLVVLLLSALAQATPSPASATLICESCIRHR